MPDTLSPTVANLIRPHYKDLAGYVSAGMEAGKDSQRVFMNANENPYQLPSLEGFNRYPEPQPPALLSAFAKHYEVEPDELLISRGADEAIVLITRLFCEPKQDAVLLCPPTFGMYGVNARSMPGRCVDVPLLKSGAGFSLDEAGILNAVKNDDSIKLVFLCSPNNPTADSFPQAQLRRLISALEGHAMVVLDETYVAFSANGSLSQWLSAHPNLLLLKTLSKSHSMAGMRIGGLISADRCLIQLMRSKCLDAYPLPVASIQAALHALSEQLRPVVDANIQSILAGRSTLAQAFAASAEVNCVYPSDSNFLLIEMPRAKEFLAHCAAADIVLRDFSNKAGTENCIRVSVGTPEQNEALLEQLVSFST